MYGTEPSASVPPPPWKSSRGGPESRLEQPPSSHPPRFTSPAPPTLVSEAALDRLFCELYEYWRAGGLQPIFFSAVLHLTGHLLLGVAAFVGLALVDWSALLACRPGACEVFFAPVTSLADRQWRWRDHLATLLLLLHLLALGWQAFRLIMRLSYLWGLRRLLREALRIPNDAALLELKWEDLICQLSAAASTAAAEVPLPQAAPRGAPAEAYARLISDSIAYEARRARWQRGLPRRGAAQGAGAAASGRRAQSLPHPRESDLQPPASPSA